MFIDDESYEALIEELDDLRDRLSVYERTRDTIPFAQVVADLGLTDEGTGRHELVIIAPCKASSAGYGSSNLPAGTHYSRPQSRHARFPSRRCRLPGRTSQPPLPWHMAQQQTWTPV